MIPPQPCGHWADSTGYCGAGPTRRYLTGWRCPTHTPAAIAGRPEAAPDPTSTLAALLARAGRRRIGTSSNWTIIDDLAVASGKSSRGAHAYREARMRIDERRSQP